MSEIKTLFDEHKKPAPNFKKNGMWQAIDTERRPSRYQKSLKYAAGIALLLFAFFLLRPEEQSKLYSNEKFQSIMALEQQLETELNTLSTDSFKVTNDHRLASLLKEIEEIDQRITHCKTEIENNPLNPNYHRALFSLYKSKRRILETLKRG